MLNYHGHHGHPRATGSPGHPLGTWWDEGGPFMGHSQVFPRASSLTAVTIRRKPESPGITGILWMFLDVYGAPELSNQPEGSMDSTMVLNEC